MHDEPQLILKVRKGQTYCICTCGRTTQPPLCNGAHKGSGIKPLIYKAEKDETLRVDTLLKQGQ